MNRIIALTLLLATLTFATYAESTPDGLLLETVPFTWPEFDAVGRVPRSVTREEYDATRNDARFVLETLRYTSGGIIVHAYAYRPRTMKARLPVIVYCRGGYVEQDRRAALAPVFRRYAEAGYAVIAPMFRESDGAGGIDEVGGADLADVMNVAPLMTHLPWVDSSRVYLFGESRGGMMVYQAIRDGFPAKAAATVGAFTDFTRLVEAHPKIYDPLVHKIWSDYEKKKGEIRDRRSAIVWADRVKTPLLILHGGADSGLDPSHSLDMASKLQTAGAVYELHIVQGGDHTLDRVAGLRDRALLDWFDRFK